MNECPTTKRQKCVILDAIKREGNAFPTIELPKYGANNFGH